MFRADNRMPTVQEYNYLRKLVDWPLFEEKRVKKALANSLCGVCIVDSNNSIVGMGRIAGDDAIYLHLLDVIVHPEHQQKGLGKMIVTELMKYADKASGKNMQVGLMASKGREQFYIDLGFSVRPNNKQGAGMMKVYADDEIG